MKSNLDIDLTSKFGLKPLSIIHTISHYDKVRSVRHIARRIPDDLISFPLRQDSVMHNLSAVLPVVLRAFLRPAIQPQNSSWLHLWQLWAGVGQILIKWFIFLPVGCVDVDRRNVLVLIQNAIGMHCPEDFQNCARDGKFFTRSWTRRRFISTITLRLFKFLLQAFNLFLTFIISLWSLFRFFLFLLLSFRLLILLLFLLLFTLLLLLLQLLVLFLFFLVLLLIIAVTIATTWRVDLGEVTNHCVVSRCTVQYARVIAWVVKWYAILELAQVASDFLI